MDVVKARSDKGQSFQWRSGRHGVCPPPDVQRLRVQVEREGAGRSSERAWKRAVSEDAAGV